MLWYLKQLFPLTYRTEYGDQEGKKHFVVWKMWFGRCYKVDDHIIGDWDSAGSESVGKVERHNLKMKLHDKLILFKINNNISDELFNNLLIEIDKLMRSEQNEVS